MFFYNLVLEENFLLNAGGAIAQTASEASSHGGFITVFMMIGVILLFAKLASLIEKIGQPAVLGELIIGIILGNLHYLGIDFFEHVKESDVIKSFAELGVLFLMFQVGLESNMKQMKSVGLPAFKVTFVGVILPFTMGVFLVPYLLPGLDNNTYLFLGATLTATSVGITARVFKDLGSLSLIESKTVLGAAVIDDVKGLIILAVVSAIVSAGNVSFFEITVISLKAFLFLFVSVFVGGKVAPFIGKLFSLIHEGVGMKLTLAVVFMIVFSYFAHLAGLAPIVGAFAAGLILDPVVFKSFKGPHAIEEIKTMVFQNGGMPPGFISSMKDKHIDELVEPLGHFFIPIFFIMTGMQVDLATMLNPEILLIALEVTLLAVIGKVAAGFFAGKGMNPWIIGWGMVPRGEVGLIFASAGKDLGVVDDKIYSIIVFVIIVTTLITPPILSFLLKRKGI